MPTFTILARCGEFDIEIHDEVDSFINIPAYIASLTVNSPEIKPRPRFQNNQVKVELPFLGVVDHTEIIPAKDGKKEYCLAHVKHADGTIVPVRYFPPQKTWKSGESANVVKGQYGPELKEVSDDSEPPF
jgi:hypothetical protein